MRAVYVLLTCLLGVSIAAAQIEPALKVGAKSYPLSELLKRPDLVAITVPHDPVYGGREMHYQAISAAALFETVSANLLCVPHYEPGRPVTSGTGPQPAAESDGIFQGIGAAPIHSQPQINPLVRTQ
jgi:hypothetical protein